MSGPALIRRSHDQTCAGIAQKFVNPRNARFPVPGGWQDVSISMTISEVITLNEPQVWAALGILAAAFAGMVTVTTQLLMRAIASVTTTLQSEISSLRYETKVEFASVRSEISSLRSETKTEIASLRNETKSEIVSLRTEFDLRFTGLQAQIDGLDRDVQAITKRVFPE